MKLKHVLVQCEDASVVLLAVVVDDGHGIKLGDVSDEYIEAIIAKSALPAEGYGGWPAPPMRVTGGGFAWRYATEPLEQLQELFEDPDYRDAVVMQDDKLAHDMDRARELHKRRLRAARAPLLLALDVEYQLADAAESVAGKKAVAKRKEELRDVTDDPAIGKAKTVAELRDIWPL